MTQAMADAAQIARWKQQAAEYAVDFIETDMVVGLGVGSTAIFAMRRLAELLQAQRLRNVVGVPCAEATAAEARRLGIPLTTLDDHPDVDVTIDGADEVDPALNLIKGGGGALLREKIVAQASRREIIVVDESKLSPALGTNFHLPVEVIPFGAETQVRFLESLGARVSRRTVGSGPAARPFTTDQGHGILDCSFGPLADPAGLAAQLASRAGIVEHGLFIGLATDVIVAGPGGVRHLRR